MNMDDIRPSTAILINNIHAIVRNGQQNLFRYHLAVTLFDVKGQGWVNVSHVTPLIAEQFNVKEDTVKRMFPKLQDAGFGQLVRNNQVYRYKSQLKLGLALDAEYISDKALVIKMSDLTKLKKARAIFELSLVEAQNKRQYTMIARQTRQDNLLGSSPVTQRAYEKIVQTDIISNYGTIGEADEDYHKVSWRSTAPVFKGDVCGRQCWVRQLPNSYSFNLKIIRRKRLGKGFKHMLGTIKPSTKSRVYFQSMEELVKHGDTGYIRGQNGDLLHSEFYSYVKLG